METDSLEWILMNINRFRDDDLMNACGQLGAKLIAPTVLTYFVSIFALRRANVSANYSRGRFMLIRFTLPLLTSVIAADLSYYYYQDSFKTLQRQLKEKYPE